MGFTKLTKFALVAIVIMSFFSSFASAQPLQKPLRWLGQGFSAGYHRCNPGPDVDYYNPWNAHNSMLISNLPQFQNRNFQSFDTSNLSGRPIYQGVPFSVYAAPKGHHNYGGYGAHQEYHVESSYEGSSYEGVIESESVPSTFEPYDAEDESEEDQWNDDDNQWNDDDNQWSDEDNEWSEEGDDSAQIQAPVPVASPFSNASFPNQQFVQPVAPAQPADPGQSLFNPFPSLNSGQ